MSVHMQKAIEELKNKMLILSTLVEENVRRAVEAIERRDARLAEEVIENDEDIDDMEVEVEEDCLRILALYQPVATDLRFIVAALKINNDLERVGDLAVNIAERALYLARQTRVRVNLDFRGMAEKTQWMLNQSLDALVHGDPGVARSVCAKDDEVDAINRDMYQVVQEGIREDVSAMDSLIHLLSVSRHLERIADLATNISEDVIYMTEGEIVRHRVEEYLSGKAGDVIKFQANR